MSAFAAVLQGVYRLVGAKKGLWFAGARNTKGH